MSRRQPIGRPNEYVTGTFLDGRVRAGAPAGVAETQAVGQRLRRLLEERDLAVSALAEQAGLHRTTIHGLLAGRTFVDAVSLARLERTLGTRLWPGPLG